MEFLLHIHNPVVDGLQDIMTKPVYFFLHIGKSVFGIFQLNLYIHIILPLPNKTLACFKDFFSRPISGYLIDCIHKHFLDLWQFNKLWIQKMSLIINH